MGGWITSSMVFLKTATGFAGKGKGGMGEEAQRLKTKSPGPPNPPPGVKGVRIFGGSWTFQ